MESPIVRSISDPGLRAAAARYERETGQSIADWLQGPLDEGMLGLWLISLGYSPFADDKKANASW